MDRYLQIINENYSIITLLITNKECICVTMKESKIDLLEQLLV